MRSTAPQRQCAHSVDANCLGDVTLVSAHQYCATLEGQPIKRPMLLAALGLASGVWAASGGWVRGGPWWLAAIALGGLWAFSALRKRPPFAAGFLTLAFVASGALYFEARRSAEPGDALARDASVHEPETQYVLEGRAESPDIWLPGQEYSVFVLRVDSVERAGEALAMTGGVLVRWSDPGRPVFEGERVQVEGPIDLAWGPVNPGAPGVEDYYRRYGVHTAMRLRGDAEVARVGDAPRLSVAYQLSRFRGYLARRIAEVVPASSLPLVLTIWLGDRRRLDAETYQAFIDSGTAHVLAVSGAHVSIMFVTLGLLLPVGVELRRVRIRAVVMLAVIVAFVMVTGARVSSMRAALMVAVYLAADWFGRERDAPTALSIAGIGFLLYEPQLLFDVGFQLSFLSVASIMLFSEGFEKGIPFVPQSVRPGVAATLAVQLLPLPFAIRAFYVLPLIAPFANLFVIPATALLLWVGFVASLGAIVFPPAAVIFGQSLHLLAQIVLWLAKELASLRFAHANIEAPTGLALVFFGLGMMLLRATLTARRSGRGFAIFCVAVLAVCAAVWSPLAPRPEMTVIDVGHGDSTFVRTPGGRTMVVDAGNRSDYVDLGRRAVAPFLWANHESKIDALLVTHPDADHIGGVKYLIEHFAVGSLVLGAHPFPGTMEDELIALCAERGVPVQRVARGDEFALGEAMIEVMNPPRDAVAGLKENELSLVVRVSWPGFSALLTGDIESEAEAQLAKLDVAAQVLKVPHHGSATSSSRDFVAAAHPEIAVISVGPRGRTTVVKPDVIRRYKDAGIRVFRTDIVGGVRFSPGNDRLRVEAARVERGYVMRE